MTEQANKPVSVDDVVAFLRLQVGKNRKESMPEIGADTKLLKAGIIDSFQILDLVEELRRSWGDDLSVSDFTPEDFETPRVLWARIEALRS